MPLHSAHTRVTRLFDQAGVVRAKELVATGINPAQISRLVQQGTLERLGRGLYRRADSDFTEQISLLEAVKRVPQGIICLLSALRFHELTTQNPFEVWLAIPPHVHRPRLDATPLRIHYFSGQSLTSGIETHLIEGIAVRVYNPAKTVADCFKFRNKIGIEVALEASRDALRTRKAKSDDIWHYAKINRVSRVIYPYLEAIG